MAFPTTRRSLVVGLRSPDHAARSEARDALVRAYWSPVYTYARLQWRKDPATAEELTQEFFLRALDHETFASFDPAKGRFRTFVRVCVDRFLVSEHRKHAAEKRGGAASRLAIDADVEDAEREIARCTSTPSDPEAAFEAAWVRHLVKLTVERLRSELVSKGKHEHLRVFELAHLDATDDDRSYADMAGELGLTITDVTNRLSYARRAFRRIALELLREITSSDEELRDEARLVFGIELAA